MREMFRDAALTYSATGFFSDLRGLANMLNPRNHPFMSPRRTDADVCRDTLETAFRAGFDYDALSEGEVLSPSENAMTQVSCGTCLQYW